MPLTTAPTVLLADDEPDLRDVARLFLEMDGWKVVGEAVDGPDALDRFAALEPPPPPSVVLLDNRMPGLSGLEVAARILEEYPDQVVVLFTAFLDDETERQARQIGITACLTKTQAPQLPEILRDLLEE